MNRTLKHTAVLLLALTAWLGGMSQVSIKASVDRSKILIGEPIKLNVEAYMPLGSTVQWLRQDSIPHFDIDAFSAVDTSQNIDGKKIEQTLTVTSFDSGRWQIPPFEIAVDGKPYYSDSITVDVAFVSFDPKEDYRDIKDIIETNDPRMKYLPWFVAAIALASLFGLVILLAKRKQESVPEVIEMPRLSAYREAVQAMEELERKGISGMEEKQLYTTMNDILRKYVSRKFNVPTFERTNEELIMQLSRMKISRDSFLNLAQSLRMADFVKFAKYRPSADDNRNNFGIVRNAIDVLDNSMAHAV